MKMCSTREELVELSSIFRQSNSLDGKWMNLKTRQNLAVGAGYTVKIYLPFIWESLS